MKFVLLVLYDWLVALLQMRDALKCVTTSSGAQYVMMDGVPLMPMSLADKLDFQDSVSAGLIFVSSFALNFILSLINYIDAQARSFAAFGQGTGPILLDNLACTGNEARLFDCPNNGIGVHNCIHAEDAGAVCRTNRKN